uniref:Sm domain-containing protein n=1 Tax=Hyaloperonospora arabidopsidis (strain Emoy2) TaxID=559515 RepID=M4B229_HYAAE
MTGRNDRFRHIWNMATETLPMMTTKKKTPSDFLKSVLGRPVDVKLNNGVEYKGVLACLDGFMNIAMEQTQEYQNGQLKAHALHLGVQVIS